MNKIDASFVFNFDNDISISDTKNVLKKYYESFKDVLNLTAELPIFLDTNILLNYYGMSIKDKEKLVRFFEEKSKNIFISQQIEKEFQRNRESTISNYFKTLSEIKKNYETDLQKGIKNKFKKILESKIVEKDFPEIMTSIKAIYNELDKKLFTNEDLKSEITFKVDNALSQSESMLFVDPILDTYSNFHRTPDLSEEELLFIKEKYDHYLTLFKDAKETVRHKFTFPGCGEKNKNDDPYGDFIILHEVFKYMKENDSDAILLTRDVTKSDWLKKDREPYIHYILKAFQLTGHILYIFDATDLLKRISFENIYKIDSNILLKEEVVEPEDFYRKKFLKSVNKVKEFLIDDFSGHIEFKNITDRQSFGHDIDLIGEKTDNNRVGVLVYKCGSTKKGFQRNIQKRINSCNKFLEEGVCDEAILVVVLNKKGYARRLDYDYINSDAEIRIVMFFMDENVENSPVKIISDRLI